VKDLAKVDLKIKNLLPGGELVNQAVNLGSEALLFGGVGGGDLQVHAVFVRRDAYRHLPGGLTHDLRGEVELDAEVIETELGKIAAGQKAHIKVAGNGEVAGTVRLVSPEVDKTTRLGRVRVFLGDDPKLRIGSFARGTIDTAQSHGLALPSSAVVFDGDGAFVQVVSQGRVARRAIETGLVAGGLVEVIKGLEKGDVVVAKAGTFLRDGDVVRAVLPDAKISEAR